MSIIRRLSATVFSQVDRAVSEIENHDAIIEAAIRDNQRALAKAKVRFNRLQADGRQLARRLDELRLAESQWTRRAKEQARGDEQTAMQCLRRRRECQRQIATIERTLCEHEQSEKRLGAEIAAMDSRVKEIVQQRNVMRTRQSTADAMRVFKSIEGCCPTDIDDTFEKWEVKILEAELASGEIDSVDSVERRFVEAEELEDLQAELRDLLDEENDDDQ